MISGRIFYLVFKQLMDEFLINNQIIVERNFSNINTIRIIEGIGKLFCGFL